jgi:zinc transport system permease protein
LITEILSFFTLAPVVKAFIIFIIAGFSFPLAGIFIVVLDLVPLRFALMHGALLGGIVGLIFKIDNILFPLCFCLVIIILLGPLSKKINISLSNISAFFMIITISIAFILIDKLNIPALEAFNIFWGNIYASSIVDIIIISILSITIIFFIIFNFKKITAVLFDFDIAYTSGIKNNFIYYFILIITGAVVALSIKIIGAMLVDCLLILPAMGSLFFSKSMKSLFINSSIIGLLSSIIGFFFSLGFKIQPSPSVTLVSVGIIFFIYVSNLILLNKKRSL